MQLLHLVGLISLLMTIVLKLRIH